MSILNVYIFKIILNDDVICKIINMNALLLFGLCYSIITYFCRFLIYLLQSFRKKY